MTLPIKLDTMFGVTQFDILKLLHHDYKVNGDLNTFRAICKEDARLVSLNLDFFLNDDKIAKEYSMDDSDTEGWRILREWTDMYNALNHFSKETTL